MSSCAGSWCVEWRYRVGVLARRFDWGRRGPNRQPRPQWEQQQFPIQSHRGVNNIPSHDPKPERNPTMLPWRAWELTLQRVKDYETETISHPSTINEHLVCSQNLRATFLADQEKFNLVARTTLRPPPKPSKPISTTPSAPHDGQTALTKRPKKEPSR